MNTDNNNLHILHIAERRTSSCDSAAAADSLAQEAEEDQESVAQPEFVPVSPLLPRGLEYEVPTALDDDDDFQLTPAALIGERKSPEEATTAPHRGLKLLVSFMILVISGATNVVTTKLQADSMFNYGIFLSLFSYIVYVPLCFAFIIPVAKYGWFDNAITAEHMALSKKSIAIMGFLDSLATVIQTFAALHLPGPLLVILPQAAIPMSMLLSKHMLGEKYRAPQYTGAAIVLVGILVVLEPIISYRRAPEYLCEAMDLLNHCTICSNARTKGDCIQINKEYISYNPSSYAEPTIMSTADTIFARIMLEEDIDRATAGDICQWIPRVESSTSKEVPVFVWSVIMVLSCVPMTLSRYVYAFEKGHCLVQWYGYLLKTFSCRMLPFYKYSVYKQVKLSCHGDLHPLFLFGWIGVFQFLFSAILAPGVSLASGLPLEEVPRNLLKGFKCYFGAASVDKGCHPDSRCASGHAFLFVNLCLLCHGIYLLCMLCVLKYGSSALLFLALTMMVPLGNLSFSLPFMESPEQMHFSDVIALIVIVLGLLLYRFGHALPNRLIHDTQQESETMEGSSSSEHQCHPLLEPLISYAYV